MKVKELIELLSQMNPELMVVIGGYEGGVDEIDKFEMCDIELNVNTEEYYGKHEILAEGDKPTNKDSTIVRGVRLIGDWS
jgi:preprotein translocase subunit YajC